MADVGAGKAQAAKLGMGFEEFDERTFRSHIGRIPRKPIDSNVAQYKPSKG